MENKKYYRYIHNLGTDEIEISEMDYYENEELDFTDVFINNFGNWEFYMYSDSDENRGMFIRQINNILLEDSQSASRLAQTAHGRFLKFQETWKKLEP